MIAKLERAPRHTPQNNEPTQKAHTQCEQQQTMYTIAAEETTA